MSSRLHDTADIDPSAVVGEGSTVWHLAQVRDDAVVGRECTIGRGAYVGSGVRIGDRCKLQNHALVYEPAVLEDGVFVGPAAVLTNDQYPRAIDVVGTLKTADDWQPVGVVVRHGASIGAGAVCVAPVEIGPWAMVAAGAVVTRDVPAYALVAGTPARRIRWVGPAGVPLEPDGEARFRCPRTGARFEERLGELMEVAA